MKNSLPGIAFEIVMSIVWDAPLPDSRQLAACAIFPWEMSRRRPLTLTHRAERLFVTSTVRQSDARFGAYQA